MKIVHLSKRWSDFKKGIALAVFSPSEDPTSEDFRLAMKKKRAKFAITADRAKYLSDHDYLVKVKEKE